VILGEDRDLQSIRIIINKCPRYPGRESMVHDCYHASLYP
jgi:hypothetical protein